MVQPYHSMVIAGFGALASLGLALPTGLAFGYGYGYGVRQGYHSYRPSKSNVTRDLHLSANPIIGAKGAGLLSAEEMTAKQAPKIQKEIPIQPTPTPSMTARQVADDIAGDRKRATQGFSGNTSTNQAYLNSPEYLKNNFVRKEAGAVVDSIDKNQATKQMFHAGKPTDERTVRRYFIKRLYPFN